MEKHGENIIFIDDEERVRRCNQEKKRGRRQALVCPLRGRMPPPVHSSTR